MRLILTAIAAMLLGASAAEAAPKWFIVDVNDSAIGIDYDSRTRTGDTAAVWIILVYAQPNPEEAGADYRLSRMEFSCSRRTGGQVSSSGFTDSGRFVGGSERRAETMAVTPGTVLEAAFDAACDRDFTVDPSELYDTEAFIAVYRPLILAEDRD